MTKQRFLDQRGKVWKRFDKLLQKQRGARFARLTPREIAEFSRLMRELSNDLATIQSRDWGQGLVVYLNDLVVRGHNALYRSSPDRWDRSLDFLLVGFPRLFRQNFGYFAVAAALFFVPFVASWIAVQNDPTVALRMVDAAQLDMVEQMYSGEDTESEDEDETAETSEMDSSETTGDAKDADAITDSTTEENDDEMFGGNFADQRAGMAGFYVEHNVSIALQCFARGLLLGLGTMYTLLSNGLGIGCITGYVLAQGHGERFLSFIVSHGSFELTAIAVSGGAGLMLGDALLHPGQRTLLDALRHRGIEAVQIATGAAVMLMVAALIEAFWSPSPIPAMVKYVVGGCLWLLVAMYLGLSGVRRT
ncbi:stage II sporulation protein M [bacterium]|nr:stage II sporulation protein M [bacterium]